MKPVTTSDCFHLGHVVKTHGYKGYIVFFLDVDYPDHYANLDLVFVEQESSLVPYFIEGIKIQQKGFALVKLEDVNADTEAKSILKKKLFLPLNYLPELDENQFYFHEIEGYDFLDKTTGKKGEVKQVLQQDVNPIIEVEIDGEEVLVPLNDDILQVVDKLNKVIEVKTPEGLLDIYLYDHDEEE